MKLVVNRDNCIGCGACESSFQEIFQLDDQGVSTVICKDFEKIDEETLDEAVNCCPVGAISKED